MSNYVENVPGLRYIPAYLSLDLQHDLLTAIDQQPWINDLKRRVQHYGYRYNYRRRTIDESLFLGPLPTWSTALVERLIEEKWIALHPNQLIVNEYLPGQGISSHIDCTSCFGDTILSISLCSSCVMIFTHTHTDKKIEILLEPRSLMVMNGESRYH